MGTQELLIVFLIVLVLFGGAKLPKLAKSMGESIKEFRKSAGELDGSDGDKDTKA
ncbi:MAG: sec-independent protein translocase protein TatA [Glaciecola sp.]|jgi:sec-independent protein translocase protein TatA